MFNPENIINWDKSKGWRHKAYTPVILILPIYFAVIVARMRKRHPRHPINDPTCDDLLPNGGKEKSRKNKIKITKNINKYEIKGILNSKNNLNLLFININMQCLFYALFSSCSSTFEVVDICFLTKLFISSKSALSSINSLIFLFLDV